MPIGVEDLFAEGGAFVGFVLGDFGEFCVDDSGGLGGGGGCGGMLSLEVCD